ncbi:MAG TPA: thiamine-phosphate kinase [Methanobacterium sp.]|nr:thiamine-phosphate kinase [Methanobacterium sp.]
MPSRKQLITELGEKKLIKRLLKKSQTILFNNSFYDEKTLQSLSDDAALLNLGNKYLVATTDLLLRSAHFPGEMSYHQMGNKIVTVNVSDLAAMGAKPLGITIAMALPPDLSISDFDQIVEGILQTCKKYEMPLIGGDTNESSELTLCGTGMGLVNKEKVLLKSGAQEGDVVAVTGVLGLAAAGFEILSNESDFKNLDPEMKNQFIKHALEPEAQLEKGLILAGSPGVTSATDITDGLLSELGEIMDSNRANTGIKLFEELIPIPTEFNSIAEKLGKTVLELVLTYGEDFELLITVQKDKYEALENEIGLHKIGYVTSSGLIHMVNKEGKTKLLTPKGYEHFK